MDVTWTSHLKGGEEDDAAVFDAFVSASPAGHFAQTRHWAPVARKGAHVATRFAIVREAGQVVGTAVVLRPVAAGIVLPWAWVERGPVVARAEDVGRVTQAVLHAARRHGIARLRVMPYWADGDAAVAEEELRRVGFRDVQRPDGAHASTLRMTLVGNSHSELFAGGDTENLRRRMRQAEKAGALARRGTSEDWPKLRTMHSDLMKSQGIRDKPAHWWAAVEEFVSDDRRGALFACDLGPRVVAAAVVIRHGAQATFSWGASVADKLPFPKAIPAFVAAIRWSRDVGCTTFDFGGIPLENDRDPKRNAIAMFKLGFSKTRVRLVREHAR